MGIGVVEFVRDMYDGEKRCVKEHNGCNYLLMVVLGIFGGDSWSVYSRLTIQIHPILHLHFTQAPFTLDRFHLDPPTPQSTTQALNAYVPNTKKWRASL